MNTSQSSQFQNFLAFKNSTLEIWGIPAFDDNYLWAIIDLNNAELSLIDPGDSTAIKTFLKEHEQRDLKLKNIFLTHHHFDHIGGVLNLVQIFQPENIFISEAAFKKCPHSFQTKISQENILLQWAKEEDHIKCKGFSVKVHEAPGHTLSHLIYQVQSGHEKEKETSINQDFWFVGDTLFSGGCGRLFEGTYEQMFTTFQKLHCHIQKTDLIFAAHEYTLKNCQFMASQFKKHPDHKAYFPDFLAIYQELQQKRAQNDATLPTTIDREAQINPFWVFSKPFQNDANSPYIGTLEVDLLEQNKAFQYFQSYRQARNNF